MIIEFLNLTFFLLILFIILSILLLYFLLRNKSEKIRKNVIIGISIFNIIFFIIYKYWLSKDPEFLTINNYDFFNLWSELPLQLCNISMFLIPLGLIFKKDALLSYGYFITPLGAFMAICFPESAFTGFDIFIPRNLGFYGTHVLLFISGISLVTLKLFKPSYKKIVTPTITLLALAFIMFLVNTVLRNTVSPEANYFYTYETNIPILSTFYKWLPVPFLYEIFTVLILVPYTLLMVMLYKLLSKRNQH